MPLYMPPKGADFELTPAGTHHAVCYRIVDLGTQQTTYLGKPKLSHLIMISWELPNERMRDGRPFSAHNRYTYSSSEKSNLRKHLQSWRGRAFTDDEFGTFELDRLLGVGCLLNVIHDERGDTTYANIAGIMQLPKGTQRTALATENEQLCFSLADRPFDRATFDKLSDRMRETIQKSPEYASAVEGRDPHEEPPPPAGESDYGGLNDDIPF